MVGTPFRLGYQVWQQGGLLSLANRVGLATSYKKRLISRYVRRQLYLQNRTSIDINSRKLIYVDPNEITHETRTKMGDILNEAGITYRGRWDKAITPFRDRYKVRSLRRRFEDGVDWEKTSYYRQLMPRIEAGLEWRGCTSADGLREYLLQYDELYKTIDEKGYKVSSEPVSFDRQNSRPRVTSELSEIGVNIGRNGELLWQGRGQHRLCIAQLLDLDEVPIQVLTRHEQWQQVKKEINSCDLSNKLSKRLKPYQHHPDVEAHHSN